MLNQSVLDLRKDFGAKGDGKSDDTSALQKAVDASAESKTAVWIPNGEYLCGRIKFHDYACLRANPNWAFYRPGSTCIKLINPDAQCLFDLEECHGIHLYGLFLDGGGIGKNVHGILIPKKAGGREDNLDISSCTINKFSGDGIRAHEAFVIRMRQCAIGHNGGDGFNYHGADMWIMDNWFSGNKGFGIRAQEGSGSTTLIGNRIEWNREGSLAISRAWNWNITGNCFDRSGGPALKFTPGNDGKSCYNFAVTGNTILRSAAGLHEVKLDALDEAHVRFEGCRGLAFTGNTLCAGVNDKTSKQKGKESPDMGMVIKDLDDSVISGNTLWKGAVKELVHDLGGHGKGFIIKDNPGSLGFLE